jgi:putative CocE/NonD family hydrolase
MVVEHGRRLDQLHAALRRALQQTSANLSGVTATNDTLQESAVDKIIRRAADRVLARILRLPPAANRYRVARGVRIAMRDGTELIADRFIPDTAQDAPTVLIRSPYGRGYPFPQFYAGPLAARGFHVLLQSVRGTYDSAGVFTPAVNEAADGSDTVAWIRKQPWFTGRLATIGPSYLGMTQWALMQDPPAELAAAVILAAPHDLSNAWATGSFALDDNARFSDGAAHLGERSVLARKLDDLLGRNKVPAEDIAFLPLNEAARAAMGSYAPLYESWLAHPDRDDPFWDTQRFGEALDRCEVPVLLVGGWQDLFLSQTLEQYRRLRDRGVEVALTIGPWVHDRMLRRGASTFIAEGVEWLACHLLESPKSRRDSPVRVFVGEHGWVNLPDWPPALAARTVFLQPGGALGGALGDSEPSPDAAPSSFLFDPANPTPTIGGPLLFGGGYVDDAALADREDVACFTGEPLAEDLYVLGTPVVELTHSADNPHVDVFVRISHVAADGVSTNVSEALRRLTLENPSEPAQVVLELDPIAHRFPAGSRLRVVVAGGSHPRFARNPGTGEALATAHELVPATHFVHHGAGGTSRVLLPAADQPPA